MGLQGATSIDTVRIATAKMSTTDVAAVLAKTKLTAAEQAQILQEKGLSATRATMIASINTMSGADLYAALTKTTLTEAITAEALAESGLTAEQIAAAVAASNLTASNLAQLLATTSLTKEQQIEILTKKGLSAAEAEAMVAKAAHTAATTGATVATGAFAEIITTAKVAVKGLTAALAANPWLLAIAAIIGLVAAFNKLSTAAVDASEKSKEAAEAAMEITKEHEAEQEQIDQLIKKYQELAGQEYIDADTRIEIRDIQKEINSLVNGEVNGLDLVNGKLDDQLLKLKQLQLEEAKTRQSDYIAARSEAKNSYNDAYIRDKSDVGGLSFLADWHGYDLYAKGYDEQVESILENVDGVKDVMEDWNFGTYTDIKFDADNAQEYYDILTNCIEALESDVNFNHYGNDVYNKLVAMRKEYSAFINTLDEATTSMVNNSITIERLELDTSGVVVDSIDSYIAYQQKLIDNLVANEDIKQLMFEGAVTSDQLQALIDNMMATQFPTYYNELNKQIQETTSGVDTLTKIINSYKNTIGKLKSATDEYNNTGSVSAETYNELIKLNKDYADLFDFSSGKISIAADEVDRLVDELIAEYGATLAANGATEAQITQMVALANSLSDVKEEAADVVDAIKDLADILQDAVDGTEMTVFETWELLENYPELASAITKTTNGYILEEAAVRELIKAKAELLGMEASEARMAARDNFINNANNVDSANNVDKIFADYYNKNGTNIKSFDEYVSAWESYYGETANGNWVEGLQEYVEAIISDNSVNNVMNSLIEDMKNPDTLLKTETEENPISNAFDELEAIYSGRLQELDYLTNTYNNAIKSLENQGYDVPASYYEKLKEVEEEKIALLGEELTALTSKFQEAINAGEIEEGSKEFYDMNNAINSVKESIQASNLALQEYSNTIRDLEWKKFDDIQDEIKKITDESEFLLDLLDDKDMVDDKGKLTEHGNAAMGLHGMNYNVYMEQARRYADEITKIEQELASDKYNQDLIDRKDELLELQRESVLAAEEEKQAMIDLVTEGIEAELDALDELIDKYKDALDEAKDLYDYQNKVSDATEEISRLQKMIIAYENDNSEEMKAQIQKLKVELQEAQEELQETEYDQFIADQKKLLDNLYDDYETILNRRLDDVSTLITDSINAINTNATDIKSTLETTASSVGTTLSDKMGTIWTVTDECKSVVSTYSGNFDTAAGNVNGNLTTIDGTISSGVTTISSTLSTIDSDIGSVNTSISNVSTGIGTLAGKLDSIKTAIGQIDNSGDASNPTGGGTGGNGGTPSGSGIKETAPNTVYTNPTTPKTETPKTETPKVETPKVPSTEELIAEQIVKFGDASGSGMNAGKSGDNGIIKWNGKEYKVQNSGTAYNSSTPLYKAAVNVLKFGDRQIFGYNGKVYGYLDNHIQELEGRFWSSAGYDNFVKDMAGTYPAYKQGGLADFTGLAWLDGTKTKPEMVLDSEDTQNFIALRDILAQLASDDIGFGNPLYSSFAPMSYGGNIPNFGEKLAQILNSYGETNIQNHFEITIPIEKVEDYNDFVTQLRDDPKFEKMVQAMTLGRLNGGSPNAKYNYSWKNK